ICTSIHDRSASTKILLLAIFPRGQQPDATRRKVDEVNRIIARLDDRDYITFLDIGARFLEPDGSISPDVMYDFLHPTAKGYGIWSAAMAPTLERLLAGRQRSGRRQVREPGHQLLLADAGEADDQLGIRVPALAGGGRA